MVELNLTVYSGEAGITITEGVPDETEAQRLQIIHSNTRLVIWIVGQVSSAELNGVLRDAMAFTRKRKGRTKARKVSTNRASSRL